jgi:hypothetical protein
MSGPWRPSLPSLFLFCHFARRHDGAKALRDERQRLNAQDAPKCHGWRALSACRKLSGRLDRLFVNVVVQDLRARAPRTRLKGAHVSTVHGSGTNRPGLPVDLGRLLSLSADISPPLTSKLGAPVRLPSNRSLIFLGRPCLFRHRKDTVVQTKTGSIRKGSVTSFLRLLHGRRRGLLLVCEDLHRL